MDNKVESKSFEWTIVGAGPAAMAVIGKLLDNGIQGNKICWIDPEFCCGDLGGKWRTVSSNTTVELFVKFLNDCKSFEYKDCPIDFKLNHLSPPNSTCLLNEIADPLQWVSDRLMKKVKTFKSTVKSIFKSNENDNQEEWEIKIIDDDVDEIIKSNNIVLAVGAEPLYLPLSTSSKVEQSLITVEQTVNLNELKKVVNENDTVAVFGSSHTAIIALYNLVEVGCSKIINFYRSPLKYAVYHDDWILYDNTGLKGYSATWAKENIENNPIKNLERIQVDNDKQLFNDKFNQCNKVIYAIGFETRNSIKFLTLNENGQQVESTTTSVKNYNKSNGIIKPNLFGIGIAFPQLKQDRVGNWELNVGLWKFMVYLNQVLPIWLNKQQE